MDLIVTPAPEQQAHRGTLVLFGENYDCALGRTGIRPDKHEGDGATPVGRFALREIRYRADRLTLPDTPILATPTGKHDGWCDDPVDPAYNRAVALPYGASAERMWRDDGLYDLLVILGQNDAPPVAGLGSAIFLHCANVGNDGELGPTEGCIALPRDTLLALVPRLTPDMMIDIRTD
ncbi:MAG: L,D-transpeptidase family protein [Rhodospirillaceae bacterium]|jgi:L,D-peptidoglycan transpeptidase YkuD (ErfK/YbiS/YcfS/YnhG family)|nr:L,D-transpeptidase family protein [Rhodospirillaceae bacterium]MBT3809602.1 L,D-transpeptidase family protein [Rhodospirillaceae bacterium]MBT4772511.1 L,D-transpeptidase family protein [Rhodospirillaceae bacterium]MBT5358100.1 L,D-transpeptidase family protein [Rhodospirillaceae bacterium]MBT5769341.1 L,D-transpeptidase family protein [Rhodospirillaceae bacterium]